LVGKPVMTTRTLQVAPIRNEAVAGKVHGPPGLWRVVEVKGVEAPELDRRLEADSF
jgi:hypothetical protein